MLAPAIAAFAWAILATVTGMLPRAYHRRGAIVLLLTAPILILWLGQSFGPVVGFLAALGAASVLRYPIKYLCGLALGYLRHRGGA